MKRVFIASAVAIAICGFSTATASALDTGSGGEPAPAPVQPQGPPPVEGAPCTQPGVPGEGVWVHLEGGNAEHYGNEWMCRF
ncbi:hypothetical protein [Nocardia concava]|uniref:hypothetical protein n=1 Tax=Nocardia concava TaxID=257281 RepID=UPI00031DB889|nr:hypothetical protein [Nocardia concava]